jgi:hypothetical protein
MFTGRTSGYKSGSLKLNVPNWSCGVRKSFLNDILYLHKYSIFHVKLYSYIIQLHVSIPPPHQEWGGLDV